MFSPSLIGFLVAALVQTLAVQVPLHAISPVRGDILGIDVVEWNLDKLPDPNATDHLIFETAHSLLHHWPNTRMRNGHNIVPGNIPKGTVFYHGRPDNELPRGPEWVAIDPEHSYFFCRSIVDRTQQGCWQLTLMTTRSLKVIHFDGSSAAKVYGAFDTQDLLIWGRLGDGNLFEDEAKRIQALCEWGKKFGVDGIVRMQEDFEIMLCDFTSGVTVVSFEHLQSKWTGNYLLSGYELFEVVTSGGRHNRVAGETRVQLDLPRLVSFYDTQLAPSLVPVRAGQERWDHRAINISSEDMLVVKSRVEANMLNADGVSSGIDWKTLFQVVVDRYGERLELTRYLLNTLATDADGVLDLARKAQTQLRIMLTPYLLYSAAPMSPSNNTELDWTIPIFKLCSTTHTHSMESLFVSMTDSEKLLLQAVRGTSREICRVVTKMWAAGVYAGIDPLLDTKESPDLVQVAQLRDTWADELEHLMGWLDWSVWVKCDPGCNFEEMCYLPTWPIGFPWLGPPWIPPPPPSLPEDYMPGSDEERITLQMPVLMDRLTKYVSDFIEPEPGEWIRPQPKCIRRVRPYKY